MMTDGCSACTVQTPTQAVFNSYNMIDMYSDKGTHGPSHAELKTTSNSKSTAR